MTWDPRERPFCEPSFWDRRVQRAKEEGLPETHAVFITDHETWTSIQESHRRILSLVLHPNDSVLDAGCSWGRLLDNMPAGWMGNYAGFDITPNFIEKARGLYPARRFAVTDIRKLETLPAELQPIPPAIVWDWCIVCSVERGLIGHLGQEAWDGIERNLLKHCHRLLSIDYVIEDDYKITEGVKG